MPDDIGRADYELGLDIEAVRRGLKEAKGEILKSGDEVEAAYRDAGSRAGKVLGTGITVGLKLVAGVAASAFALATKGVLDLENVTADFRAETGATAEEAKRAGKAINEMSGRNIAPLKEIGQALTKVHTDLGLTGDEAEKTTELFVKFARATKQDASAAVLAFDKILDAWGLTAADAQGLMDKLVFSTQKYGGSVEGLQTGLANLAPQMRALNLTVDDTIGLLNLFEESGLDASKAQGALNSAISKLPPNTTLPEFIAQLAAIEDPGERARKAVEVFGMKAGAGMANAIQPGIKGLGDFTVSQEEATGSMVKSGEALDSTFGARAQLMLKGFSAALTDLGQQWGPVLTGLASLGSLGGGLLVKTLGPKLIEAFRSVGQKAGNALGDGIEAVWTGAQGTVLGNFIASRIEVILGPKNSRIGDAARAAGAKAGALFGPAFALASKLGEAVADLFMKLPGLGMVRSALLTAGMATGGAFGAAVTIGVGAGIVGLAVVIADKAREELKKVDISKLIFGEGGFTALEGVGEWMNSLPWPIGPVGMPDWARIGADTTAGVDTAVTQPVVAALTDTLAKTGDLGSRLTVDLAAKIKSGEAVLRDGAWVIAGAISDPIAEGAAAATRAVSSAGSLILSYLQRLRTEIGQVAQGAADATWDPQIKAAELAATRLEIAAQTVIINDKKSTAEQVREATLRRLELQKTLFLQLNDLTTYGTNAQQSAAIWAALASKEVATAYANGTPAQRAAIDEWRTVLIARLESMTPAAEEGGRDVGGAFAKGLEQKKPTAAEKAKQLAAAATHKMQMEKANAETAGTAMGRAYADSIHDQGSYLHRQVQEYLRNASKQMRFQSPPKEGPLRDIYKWGAAFGAVFPDALAAAASQFRSSVSGFLEAGAQPLRAPALQPVLAGPTAGATSISHRYGDVSISAPVSIALPVGWRGSRSDVDLMTRQVSDGIAENLRFTLHRNG